MIAILIILGYIAVGAITGGCLQQINEDEHDWNDHVFSITLGIIWPATWFWLLFVRPIAKAGKYLGESYQVRQEQRQRIRVQLEEEADKKRREEEQALRELEVEQEGESALKRYVHGRPIPGSGRRF